MRFPRSLSHSALRVARFLCLPPFLAALSAHANPTVLDLWPGPPPGEVKAQGDERDTSRPGEKLVAGRPVIRLGHVTRPQLHVHLPTADKATGTGVIIAPGGGFHILAWDLEGTEVAEWFQSLGVAAFVLKYRVPTASLDPRWKTPVIDGQRAISVVRSRAAEWGVHPERIGILGFSAGGHLASRCALGFAERHYAAVDSHDQASCRPNFAALIYSAYAFDEKEGRLRPDVVVPKDAPPLFFAHTFDDGVRVENALLLAAEAKKAGVPAELHVYDVGGHGYGLRPRAGFPVSTWPARCEEWMARNGWLALPQPQ
jgi:acetyl esterase/lipase